MSIINWVIENLAGEDVIDLCFELSDLADVHITESDIYENAYHDSMANTTELERKGDLKIPAGKRVL